VLRLSRVAGYGRSFALPTRPANPSRSVDVGLRDDARRRLILLEAVNTVGDLGASVRSSSRKRAEAEALAATRRDGSGYRVFSCWVVRARRLATAPSSAATPRSLLRAPPARRCNGSRRSRPGSSLLPSRASSGVTSPRARSSPGAAADSSPGAAAKSRSRQRSHAVSSRLFATDRPDSPAAAARYVRFSLRPARQSVIQRSIRSQAISNGMKLAASRESPKVPSL
jgi:hypothetical protein